MIERRSARRRAYWVTVSCAYHLSTERPLVDQQEGERLINCRRIGICFAAVILTGCADGPTRLQRSDIPFHRGLPHAYYDQVTASVRSLHPGHEVVVDVRITLIGDKTVSVYAYSTTAGAETVHIEGCVVIGTTAQVFRGHTTRPLLNETLKHAFGADLKELLDHRVPPALHRSAVSGGRGESLALRLTSAG